MTQSFPISEAIERLKLEIAKLSDELRKSLQDSVYVRMSPGEHRVYEEKCKERNRLLEELARLHHQPPAA